jgi:hypothetical protein
MRERASIFSAFYLLMRNVYCEISPDDVYAVFSWALELLEQERPTGYVYDFPTSWIFLVFYDREAVLLCEQRNCLFQLFLVMSDKKVKKYLLLATNPWLC